jgi:pilus assembly protein CpaC
LSEAERSLHQALSETLTGRRGLELDIDPSSSQAKTPRLRVRGRLLRWDDWLAIAEALKSRESGYVFEATMSPEVRALAHTYFKSRFRASFLPDLALQVVPSAEVVLPAESAELKERVARVLAGFGFRISANASALSIEPMVRVRLIVAEFRKNMMRKLGITWPATADAQVLPAFRLPGADGLTVTVNALEDNGLAKVLASPTLLCRSGKEAMFLAGGELPMKIVNQKTRDILWKKYGVLLKIRPKADFSGRMSINIETEVSTLDVANAVDGIPGILANRIESHFDLSSSRTIVLSGLLKQEQGESVSGLPGLTRLPVLGPLFSSRSFRDHQTELAVFVTPEIARFESESP